MVIVCIKFISLRKIVHSYLAHEIIALFQGHFCEDTKNYCCYHTYSINRHAILITPDVFGFFCFGFSPL
jgi:sorbitol-specific phosphotransferase system component IIA